MSYLQSLPVFFTVVEEGSFSAAAKKLNVTQPTISFHIDNLEKKLGCQLFLRNIRGVSPTVYGEKLYHSTCKIEAVVQETYKEIWAMQNGDTGHIVLGASSIPADYILPSLLGNFLKTHQQIKISLKSDDSDNILSNYAKNELAIAIIGHEPPKQFLSHPLWHDELILVTHPEIAREFPTKPSLTIVKSSPMIIREPSSGTRKTLAKALQSHGIALTQCNIVMEVSGNQALKSTLLSQLGIAFISRWAVQNELNAGSLITIPLPGLEIKRQFYGLTKTPLQPTCVEMLWDYLKTTTDIYS